MKMKVQNNINQCVNFQSKIKNNQCMQRILTEAAAEVNGKNSHFSLTAPKVILGLDSILKDRAGKIIEINTVKAAEKPGKERVFITADKKPYLLQTTDMPFLPALSYLLGQLIPQKSLGLVKDIEGVHLELLYNSQKKNLTDAYISKMRNFCKMYNKDFNKYKAEETESALLEKREEELIQQMDSLKNKLREDLNVKLKNIKESLEN